MVLVNISIMIYRVFMAIEALLRLLVWMAVAGMVSLALDRALLSAEARGWIYYRKGGFARPGSPHHLNELSEAFGSGKLPAIEEEVQQDETGDPLGGESWND